MLRKENLNVSIADADLLTPMGYGAFLRLVAERFKDPEFKKAFEEQQKQTLQKAG